MEMFSNTFSPFINTNCLRSPKMIISENSYQSGDFGKLWFCVWCAQRKPEFKFPHCHKTHWHQPLLPVGSFIQMTSTVCSFGFVSMKIVKENNNVLYKFTLNEMFSVHFFFLETCQILNFCLQQAAVQFCDVFQIVFIFKAKFILFFRYLTREI